jgi:hypothetical protein
MERERRTLPHSLLPSLLPAAPASAGAWFFPLPHRSIVIPRKV